MIDEDVGNEFEQSSGRRSDCVDYGHFFAESHSGQGIFGRYQHFQRYRLHPPDQLTADSGSVDVVRDVLCRHVGIV